MGNARFYLIGITVLLVTVHFLRTLTLTTELQQETPRSPIHTVLSSPSVKPTPIPPLKKPTSPQVASSTQALGQQPLVQSLVVTASVAAFDEKTYYPEDWSRGEELSGLGSSFADRSASFFTTDRLQRRAVDLCTEPKLETPFQHNRSCELRDGCYTSDTGACFPGTTPLFTGVHVEQEAFIRRFLPAGASDWPQPPKPQVNPSVPKSPKGNGNIERVLPQGGDEAKELVCSYQTQTPTQLEPHSFLDRQTLEYLEGSSPITAEGAPPLPAEAHLKAFKFVTGAQFERWYDWEGPVNMTTGTPNGDDDFFFSGSVPNRALREKAFSSSKTKHAMLNRERDQLYMLENFCVRPDGKLAGHTNGTTLSDIFTGGTEVTSTSGAANWEEEMYFHDWLTNIEKLETKPQWYVDRPLVIIPMVGEWSVHPGHALQRAGNIVWNADSAFPRKDESDTKSSFARADVTSMYVSVVTQPKVVNSFAGPRPLCRKKPGSCQWSDYGYQHYTSLATTTHFMTSTQFVPGMATERFINATQAGSSMSRRSVDRLLELLLQRPVCFKEAVVWQACPYKDCNRPHEGNAWPLYGWRNPLTQREVARRFRACAGVEHLARRKVDPNNLTIMFQFRTHGMRVVQGNPHLAAVLERYVSERKIGRLVVASLRGSVAEFTALYSQVDIIISPYGSGLLYGFLTPVGSAGIELSYSGEVTPRERPGLNKNQVTDYGSLWAAQRGHHIAVRGDMQIARWYGKFDIPPKLMLDSLKSAICAINASSTSLPAYLTDNDVSESMRWDMWRSSERRPYKHRPLRPSLNESVAQALAKAPQDLLRTLSREILSGYNRFQGVPDDEVTVMCDLKTIDARLDEMKTDSGGAFLKRALREFLGKQAELGHVSSGSKDRAVAPTALNYDVFGWLLAMMGAADEVGELLSEAKGYRIVEDWWKDRSQLPPHLRKVSKSRHLLKQPSLIVYLVRCPTSEAARQMLHRKITADIRFLKNFVWARTQFIMYTHRTCQKFPIDSTLVQTIVDAPFTKQKDGIEEVVVPNHGGVRFCGSILADKSDWCSGQYTHLDLILTDRNVVKTQPQVLNAIRRLSNDSKTVLGFQRTRSGKWFVEVSVLRQSIPDATLPLLTSRLKEHNQFKVIRKAQEFLASRTRGRVAIFAQLANPERWPDVYRCIRNVGAARSGRSNLSSSVIKSLEVRLSFVKSSKPSRVLLGEIRNSLSQMDGIDKFHFDLSSKRGGDGAQFMHQIEREQALKDRRNATSWSGGKEGTEDSADSYAYILKIHTGVKESLGERMYDSLCGSPAQVRSIIEAMDSDVQLGMVSPLGMAFEATDHPSVVMPELRRRCVSPNTALEYFYQEAMQDVEEYVKSAFGQKSTVPVWKYPSIVSGAFFWARYSALRPRILANISGSLLDTMSVKHKTDRNVKFEAVMERFLPSAVVAQGWNIAEVAPAVRPLLNIRKLSTLESDSVRQAPFFIHRSEAEISSLVKRNDTGIYGLNFLSTFEGCLSPVTEEDSRSSSLASETLNRENGESFRTDVPFMVTSLLGTEASICGGATKHIWKNRLDHLASYFKHPHYIRFRGKPVLGLHGLNKNNLAELVPVLEMWRKLSQRKYGFADGLFITASVGSGWSSDLGMRWTSEPKGIPKPCSWQTNEGLADKISVSWFSGAYVDRKHLRSSLTSSFTSMSQRRDWDVAQNLFFLAPGRTGQRWDDEDEEILVNALDHVEPNFVL